MSNQTSLATDADRTAAAQNTADYTASAAAHIAGDWGKHNQIAVYDQPFETLSLASGAAYADHVITDAKCLRFLVTINGADYAVIIPGIPIGTYTGGDGNSGSPSATAPTFTTEPTGAAFLAGTLVTLRVAVTGTAPILLQWMKNGAVIPGATSLTYAIPSFQAEDTGNYLCVATNSVGQTLSTTATLSLRSSESSTIPTRSGVSTST